MSPAASEAALAAGLERVLARLEAAVRGAAPSHITGQPPREETPALDPDSGLEHVRRALKLSPFERDVLLMTAGMELDSRFPACCDAAGGATFGLALAALDAPDWRAITLDAPLRRYRLVEVAPATSTVRAGLRLDVSILPWLFGDAADDPVLSALAPDLPEEPLTPSQEAVATRAATAWSPRGDPRLRLVFNAEAQGAPVTEAARRVWRAHEFRGALALAADAVPASGEELEALLDRCARQARLGDQVVLLVGVGEPEPATIRFFERVDAPAIWVGPDAPAPHRRTAVRFDVGKPTREEQRLCWSSALGPTAGDVQGWPARLAWQFDLSASAIGQAAADAGREDMAERGRAAWRHARRHGRPRLDGLARRVRTGGRWDDLALPRQQTLELHGLTAQLAQRAAVYDGWGFAAGGERGLGSTVLFTGPSGVGKTTAAEAVAHALDLDLHRVDLSAVVSKYIGETEKHLRRLFDAADEGGAVLLFDEADALFSRRTEVKDSHDRNANLEVSYLLQRLETFRGLAILTTNLRGSLDAAFLRRLRLVVNFPFPDEAQRAAIWSRALPSVAVAEGLDLRRLAQITLSGGQIRSAALNAAFMAAEAGERIRMHHLVGAARREHAKQDKVTPPFELRGMET